MRNCSSVSAEFTAARSVCVSRSSWSMRSSMGPPSYAEYVLDQEGRLVLLHHPEAEVAAEPGAVDSDLFRGGVGELLSVLERVAHGADVEHAAAGGDELAAGFGSARVEHRRAFCRRVFDAGDRLALL